MELIKLSSNSDFPVDSRDLHVAMEVKTPHVMWIQRKLEDFIEGEDFLTDLLGQEKVFMLTIDVAKHLAMLERSEKGKQVRQWFIEREKQISRPRSSEEMFLHSAQILVEQKRKLEEQDRRITAVEQAVSYTAIHDMVKDSLKEETINEFPAQCSRLETIRDTVFIGISPAIISKFLIHIGHATKEYKFKMADNILRSQTVYCNNGLVDAFIRFKNESVFQKVTLKNVQYTHPVVGNYKISKEFV